MDRVTKMAGGKMRPREAVYYRCQLSCGHVVEKLKSLSQAKPPRRMACHECRAQEVDAQP